MACASQDLPVLLAPQPGMSLPVDSICYHMQATAADLVQGTRPDADHLGVTLTPRPGGIARSRQHLKTTRFLRFFRRVGSVVLRLSKPKFANHQESSSELSPSGRETSSGSPPRRRPEWDSSHPSRMQRLHLSAMAPLFPQQMQNTASNGSGWPRRHILAPIWLVEGLAIRRIRQRRKHGQDILDRDGLVEEHVSCDLRPKLRHGRASTLVVLLG